MRRPICEYGDCTADICPVRVAIHDGIKKQLVRFCSRCHASLWFAEQAALYKEPEVPSLGEKRNITKDYQL